MSNISNFVAIYGAQEAKSGLDHGPDRENSEQKILTMDRTSGPSNNDLDFDGRIYRPNRCVPNYLKEPVRNFHSGLAM